MILFDFDGTLVDSANSILVTIKSCIAEAGASVIVEPTERHIGPPLPKMIENLIGSNNPAAAQIESLFRQRYDQHGFMLTLPYPGICEVLAMLHKRNIQMQIVSNKRIVPVRAILKLLNWSHYFTSIWTLDSTLAARSKSDVVARVLMELRPNLDFVTMIGDTSDDFRAAKENCIHFGWARWGYGDPSLQNESKLVFSSVSELAKHFI